jgi:hypothetical protein
MRITRLFGLTLVHTWQGRNDGFNEYFCTQSQTDDQKREYRIKSSVNNPPSKISFYGKIDLGSRI